MPPLSSFAEDASILEQGYLIPTNDRSPRDVFGESNTLSKKQSSDKIKSRSSEKLRKIKRQVRKNVVVVNSNKVKSQKLSSKKMSSDDAVEAFRRLESDLTSAPSRDSYDTTSPSNLKKLGSTVELENVTRLESFSSMVTKSCAPEIPDEGEEKEENVDIGSNKAPQNLLSRKSKMSNVVGTMLAVNKTVKKWTEFFGKSSCQVESAANLKRHIIVFGANASALQLFISGMQLIFDN